MRRIILNLACSLDGYIARLDGGFDWIPPAQPDEDYGLGEFGRTVDALVMGRKTHDLMLAHGQGAYPGMITYVFSRSKPPGKRESVEYVAEDLPGFVRALKRRPGRNIWLFGGGEIVRVFLQHSLVDEIQVGVCPVLLGAGIRLFPGPFPQTDLEFVGCKSYPAGAVALHYRRKPRPE